MSLSSSFNGLSKEFGFKTLIGYNSNDTMIFAVTRNVDDGRLTAWINDG